MDNLTTYLPVQFFLLRWSLVIWSAACHHWDLERDHSPWGPPTTKNMYIIHCIIHNIYNSVPLLKSWHNSRSLASKSKSLPKTISKIQCPASLNISLRKTCRLARDCLLSNLSLPKANLTNKTSKSWTAQRNLKVWPLKWKLSMSTF